MSSVSVAFRYLLSLSFGLTGGAIFYLLGLPLPWMLGAMLLTLICSVSGLPLASPKSARPAMSAIIGVVLGTYFQPELFAHVGEWLFSISALFAFIALAGGIGVSYFHFVGRMDWKTAYFAGMPGGLIEMVLAADANGADSRKVALVHSTRIFLTVMMLPPLVTWMEGAAGPASARPMMPVTLESVLLVALLASGGALLARLLHLPARYLMGPMLLCAVLNLSGVLHDLAPPTLLVWGAQIVIGTVIGCRFIGVDWRHVIGVVVLTAGSILAFLCLAFGVALLLQAVMDIPLAQGVLAFAPGGVAEMSLVAIALHVDAAYVALHHVIRISVVMAAAPLVFKLLKRGT
ncbi:AbrB family transcriptional regulator [Stappia stellulata]|uniref:AbrB family transcriptional regulator n=1 Tax=Stappia stellulata TaxID=71235 RepID=UPI001CD5E88D|nr:AbrB family transcriptional regulator [Stappia stellulata]MCA1244767.1 AbrB family transcriptional regulator [Stappia stellulata]